MENLKRERKSSEMVSAYYREELMRLFRAEFTPGFFVIRTSENTFLVRYPLTNTYFRVKLDVGYDTHWHITDSNCRQYLSAEHEMDLTECVGYIEKHRYGNAMRVYYSYA